MTLPGPSTAGPTDSRLTADVAAAVSAFGAAVAPRLASLAGEPEDQMRGPLEALLDATAASLGVRFSAVGEASLADLRVRPDYATLTNGAITGYVEVKRPGRGADPTRWSAGSHDAVQWSKLRALPNVLYTDGQQWALYRTGERAGDVVTLAGDVHTAGADLSVPDDSLARLLSDFLLWKPIPPRSISQLVNSVAPLTRLLREEVTDTLAREQRVGDGPFSRVATDWRALLFPDADDAAFADQYAQAVTFALLLARTEDIDFTGKTVDGIARELGRTHSLLGKALAVLTDETIGVLTVTLDTLMRVIAVVEFGRFAHHRADPYLHLYEHFLAVYDPALRKLTGSYYTPAAVVSGMTRLTDEVLRTRLGRDAGLADPTVTIVDPAMGTGAYVLDVLETVADTVRAEQGPGAVPGQLKEAASRIVGVEKQTGPFAVAELRVAEALHRHGATAPAGGVRLYVADTLDNPFAEQARLAATLDPIAISRRHANKMKAEEPVLVVLGNPPYRERARGLGGFIEDGATNTAWTAPPLDAFRQQGTVGYKDLANLYVYFWRWATWKVFDAHPDQRDGIICFITTSGYLKGPGFAGMRRYLRENASEGWIIDGTPEGHQPEVSTRIFSGVQQPVAIGIFVRRADTDTTTPAMIRYRALHGRQTDKFDALKAISVDDSTGWEDCPADWAAPFLPAGGDHWVSSPALGDLLPWQSPGISPNRTWVYAPLQERLRERWRALVTAPAEEQPTMFRRTRDTSVNKRKPGLPGFPHGDCAVAEEDGDSLAPVPVAYRSFDTQFLIPDDRLLDMPRPDLWRVRGQHQLYATEQHVHPIKPGGPAVIVTAHTPDVDHYNGRGGRVLPLYASADTSRPNLAPGLLEFLDSRLGLSVEPQDLMAYIAAVTAHPAFTTRFAEDLRTPGIRVPLTADPEAWSAAVGVGRRVLWLHTRGARMVDPTAGRPAGPPRLPDGDRPKVITAIPDTADGMPDELAYDPGMRLLSVGAGRVGPVRAEVWDYQVSGMNVLRKWFGYRRATRPKTRGEQSPLDDIRPTSWPAAYTTDLLNLIEVLTLVVAAEAEQELVLDRVMDSPRITVADLTAAGVLPVPAEFRSPLRATPPPASPEQDLLPGI